MKKLLCKLKELSTYFRNIFRLYKKIWKFDKPYIFMSVFIIIINIIHPFNKIYFLKVIVDELTSSLRWTYAITYVMLMCFIELILRLLIAKFFTYEQRKIQKFKTVFLKEINVKTMSLSYQQIEDPKLTDDKQKALEIFHPGQAHFMDLRNTIIDSKALVSHCFRFIGLIAILVTLKPFVFLILLVTYFISIILNTIASDKEFNVWSNSLVKLGRRIGYFQELATNFNYAKEMRVNKLGQWIVDKMNGYFKNMKKDVTRAVNTFTIIAMIANTLQVIINCGVYFYIGWLAYESVISVSTVIVYLNSLVVFVSALVGMSNCLISLQKSGMHLSTYFNYLKTVSKNDVVESSSDTVVDSTDLQIEFIDVWFKYPHQEHYAIKNLNLKVNANEKLAIVGENGAGKTTLIKLILRFYKPTKGQILINGIDINKINIDNYMKNVAAVFQDFNIISFPLIENIVFDNNYDNAEIDEIIQDLNLEKTIENLPRGVDTELGRMFYQDGIELSGGQQQKLAIARTLYKDSPIIILDEPTAMLSPKAEHEIYSNFAQLAKEKTTIYISHRMSSCIFCNRIVVMKFGEMVELGSHDELMEYRGEYHNLYTTQAEFYKDLDN